MLSNSQSNATVDQSIKLPDYFSCQSCTAHQWAGELCAEFQAAGRCRAAALAEALRSGAVQITLYLPAQVTK